MSYCTNCGTQVTPEMLYCPKCGRRLMVPSAGTKEGVPAVPANPVLSQAASKQEGTRSEVKKGKLFKEWVKYAGLSTTEEPPQKEVRAAKGKGRLFYILIGIGIAACVGLIILLVKIW